MRAMILMACVLAGALSPTGARAQNEQIHGRIRINPPVQDPIDVVLEVLQGDGQLVDEILVDHSNPYRFNGFAPIDRDVTIRIVVESPEGYVPSRPDYSKPACCAFNRNIRLKRPADLYLEYRDLAAETSDLENALDRYAMAETFGHHGEPGPRDRPTGGPAARAESGLRNAAGSPQEILR